MAISSKAQAGNLGQNIDHATRRKFIRAATDRLKTLKDSRTEAINRINTRNTLGRLSIHPGYTDDMIYAVSAQVDEDAAFAKAMHAYDVRLASLERLLLEIEERFGGAK